MAAKRIFRDLLALVAEPIPDCNVLLKRDAEGELMLNVWYIQLHARGVRDEDGKEELLFKAPFELRFPPNYPTQPPELHSMCTHLTHPCVVATNGGHVVCLTMFDRAQSVDGSNNAHAAKIPFSGWTAAFSGHAVLMQLQGFFEEAVWRTEPSNDDLEVLRAEAESYESSVLEGTVHVEALPIRRKFHLPTQKLPESHNANPQTQSSVATGQSGTNEEKRAEGDDGFILCVGRKAARAQPASGTLHTPTSGRMAGELSRFMCASCLQMKGASNFSKNSLTAAEQPVCLECLELRKTKPNASAVRQISIAQATSAGTTVPAATSNFTKSQLRNLRRAKKRQAGEHAATAQPTTSDAVLETKSDDNVEAQSTPEENQGPPLKAFLEFVAANLPADMLVLDAAPPTPNFVPAADAQTVRNAGLLGKLSNQLVQRVLLYLRPEDVINTTKTCRLFSQVGADGYIWKHMIQMYFPTCRYWSEKPQDWRAIFALQANAIHDTDLVCWQTKRSYKEDELGILLRYTINPTTRKVDYIISDMELISRTAYMANADNSSIWGERFMRWLPLYIDADHFQRSFVSITTTITAIASPNAKSTIFSPKMVLDVLPKFLNTIIVLLADEATTKPQTQQLLRGYLMVHRLFIALVQRYASLRQSIHQTLKDFAAHERNRVKSACPSLGEIFPLIAVSQSIGWKDVGPALLQELLDRSVLWTCRDVSQLNQLRQHVQTADMELLARVFEARRVSNRLNAFHVCFLRILAQPTGISLAKAAAMYDSLLGVPSVHLVRRLHNALDHVINMQGWPAYFQAVCAPVPSPLQLCNMLADSVNNSLRKQYHSLTTDFSRIQSRGVSNILLRGKSYQYSCFVIDISRSMRRAVRVGKERNAATRLDTVKDYLRDALSNHINHRDSFNVVFFNHTLTVWDHGLQQATLENVEKALQFIHQVQSSGGTNIHQAVEFAYSLPNIAAVYLLSDGESHWPDVVSNMQRLSKAHQIPCHTTSFHAGQRGQDLMRLIAASSGGEFLHIAADIDAHA